MKSFLLANDHPSLINLRVQEKVFHLAITVLKINFFICTPKTLIFVRIKVLLWTKN